MDIKTILNWIDFLGVAFSLKRCYPMDFILPTDHIVKIIEKEKLTNYLSKSPRWIAHLAGAVEYTDCFSAKR